MVVPDLITLMIGVYVSVFVCVCVYRRQQSGELSRCQSSGNNKVWYVL